ncbi:hypothetical protein FA13DRAFT_1718049 [Coprinellus micaceus]|uniref:NADP-dependent oxidoreductase domain-containing protein n=1 Tax=Coprinellus micaceus TaxID=71717 RepID=A0A4Y7SED5_COPMI|nr:hypothetical protein FA13DRAFT_1718049 [Coprinellus micaceus]
MVSTPIKREIWYGSLLPSYSCSSELVLNTFWRTKRGQFQESSPLRERIVGEMKWCVFKQVGPTPQVEWAALQERMIRMRTKHVGLLQFHWQEYSDKGYLTVLSHLNELRKEGHIRAIGLCNFDTIHTDGICTQLGPGVMVIVSNQVQFSLIDTGPLHGISGVCAKHGFSLLTYGTPIALLLSAEVSWDKWLGQPEPDSHSGQPTPSQRKISALSAMVLTIVMRFSPALRSRRWERRCWQKIL